MSESIGLGHASVNLYAAAIALLSAFESGGDTEGQQALRSAADAFAIAYPKQREFFAIGPNVWGRGLNAELAKDAMRKSNGRRMPGKYIVKSCPEGTEIEFAFGGLCWPGLISKIPGARRPFIVETKGFRKKELAEIMQGEDAPEDAPVNA